MSDIKTIIKKQREFYATNVTKDYHFRREQLSKLRQAVKKHEEEILEALNKDLNKSRYEAYMTEIGMVLEEIRFVSKHLKKWMKPKRVKTPLTQFPAKSSIYSEPYGVVLIMSPWNYPFQLSIEPLIGALAAGNCAIIKPSNYSFYTSQVIAKMIEEVFDPAYVTTVLGGREANQDLLEQEFDYIFFTGGVNVGKVVMASAAKYLTPISLELGGKSPCIVDATANIDLAARRIVWGKFVNAGQTCVAPDYLLVHKSVKDELFKAMKRYVDKFHADALSEKSTFPKIINEKHFARLLGLMEDGEIVFGGKSDAKTNRIEPTLIDKVDWESPVMQEELFGPIMPAITFSDLNEVLKKVQERPKPLALYLFTTCKENEEFVLKNVSFGGGCVNDTIVHLATSYLPFGGVGGSGMGSYHGKASFDTFSHKKSIMKKSLLLDIPLRYPPYKENLSIIKKFMK
ncbi:MAG: aldehyde dehydrogenase [Acholeplasmataceae bacterium]|nr:aldehyde dehydrogenase [Acholeplasmataceae bacterium]